MYAQNGVVVRQTESINWFADSPDFTMEGLNVPITYGTVTNPTTRRYNGVFKTCPMDLASANEVEFNIKYRILGWNRDAQSYVGQFYSEDLYYNRHGIDFLIDSVSSSLQISYFANGNNNSRVMLYESTAFTFSIQDDIEYKYIANKLNSSVYVRLKQNGTTLVDTTFTNIDGLTFSNSNRFNFFGIRASIDANYSAPAMLYLDSTNFKADGVVVWGSTKV